MIRGTGEHMNDKSAINESKKVLHSSKQPFETGIQLYKALLDSADQGFYIIDMIFDKNDRPVDMYFVEGNSAAIQILGMDYTGKRLSEIGFYYKEYWLELFGGVAMTGHTVRMEQYADPDKKWFECSLFRIGGEDSRRIGNIFSDISERKEIEERARIEDAINAGINRILKEALFCRDEEELGMICLKVALALTGSRIGFISEINSQGYLDNIAISELSREACRMPDNVHNKLPKNLEIRGLYKRVLQEGVSLIANVPGSHPDSIGLPEGHPPVTSFIGVPLFENGQIIGLIGLGNKASGYCDTDLDILEKLTPSIVQVLMRNRAEVEGRKARDQLELLVDERTKELHQERQRLLYVLETLPVGIFLIAPDYTIPFANRTFREKYGDSQGRRCFEYIFGFDKPCKSCQSLRPFQTGQPHHWLFTSHDDRVIDIYDYPFIDADGTSLVLEMNIDITDQRKMEAELARLDRLNLIGEMAASIGHEIRNPMTAVRGFLQMLINKAEYANDKSYFDLMIEELDRANEIISEYLGMARDKVVNLQPNGLDNVINSLLPMITSQANLGEINVQLDLHAPLKVLIDENEIRQLILNMSRNAMEAMSIRGTLTIGTRQESSETILFIKDEGHGLSPEIIDKLGTPFLTTKENGTGLGLAVCYSIAARHNARIDYETRLSGTTFFVRFPTLDQ